MQTLKHHSTVLFHDLTRSPNQLGLHEYDHIVLIIIQVTEQCLRLKNFQQTCAK